MSVAALILSATLGILLGIPFAREFPRIWLATILIGMSAALLGALIVMGGAGWEWQSAFLIGGERLHLRLDGLSAFFLVLLCVVGGAGAVYAREYWSDEAHPKSAKAG